MEKKLTWDLQSIIKHKSIENKFPSAESLGLEKHILLPYICFASLASKFWNTRVMCLKIPACYTWKGKFPFLFLPCYYYYCWGFFLLFWALYFKSLPIQLSIILRLSRSHSRCMSCFNSFEMHVSVWTFLALEGLMLGNRKKCAA